jgi:hypothetical protein
MGLKWRALAQPVQSLGSIPSAGNKETNIGEYDRWRVQIQMPAGAVWKLYGLRVAPAPPYPIVNLWGCRSSLASSRESRKREGQGREGGEKRKSWLWLFTCSFPTYECWKLIPLFLFFIFLQNLEATPASPEVIIV